MPINPQAATGIPIQNLRKYQQQGQIPAHINLDALAEPGGQYVKPASLIKAGINPSKLNTGPWYAGWQQPAAFMGAVATGGALSGLAAGANAVRQNGDNNMISSTGSGNIGNGGVQTGGINPNASIPNVGGGGNSGNNKNGNTANTNVDPNVGALLLSMGFEFVNGVLQYNAAKHAAYLQADAAGKAALLQSTAAQNSLDFAKQVYGDQQTQNAPFLQAGQNALAEVQKLLGPGGELSGSFKPPTMEEVRNQPGYQLELGEAMKALERTTRGVTNGGTIKRAVRYANDFADTKYGQEADRALNTFQTNRANRLNPLLQIAGFGPNAVAVNSANGNNAVQTTTGINQNNADAQSGLGLYSATARANGRINSTNALTDALDRVNRIQQQRW